MSLDGSRPAGCVGHDRLSDRHSPIPAFLCGGAPRPNRSVHGRNGSLVERKLFAIWMIILGNVLWVVACLALLSGIIAPNALGVIFILAQAVVVAVLAWLELKAHRSGRS